jgi:uncharacterized protein (DUF2141 family)
MRKSASSCFLALVLFFNFADVAFASSLTVNVTDVTEAKGKIFVALTKTIPEYEDASGKLEPYRTAKVKAEKPGISLTFDGIEPGEYALKIFHDANANDKFDTNFLGMPTEDYGFSNSARAMFGPPDYEDAKFKVDADDVRVTVRID